MSKSTYIKDLKQKPQQTEPETPPIRISEIQSENISDADITLNEIIDEVSVPVDKMPKENMKGSHEDKYHSSSWLFNPSVFYKDALEQRQLTNQLQQQLLQQQLLQQQLLSSNMEKKIGFGVNFIMSAKRVFFRELMFILSICILYGLFQNLNVLSIIKIDRISAIHTIPFLKQTIITILFAFISTILKIHV
jgi:hypothetical protein